MTYRIIQWGTGNVGKHALRAIVERPDFELVGLRVYNPDKVGVDAGELLGRDRTGITATDDVDAILALDADCVSYSPLGATTGDSEQSLDDMCRILASGKNCVSAANDAHSLLRPDVQLARAGENAYERLTKACEAGQSTFFHVGINPGYAMETWPMTISRVCRRIDHMTISEIVDMSGYTSEHMVREAIGFGQPPDRFSVVDENMKDVYNSVFYLCLRILTEGMGITLEDVKYHRDIAVTDHDLEVAVGTIEAGTVGAMKLVFDGMMYGRPVITYEWIWRIHESVAPEWPAGDSRWLIDIKGDPDVKSEIDLSTTEDAGRATSLSVATLLLNSIPTVVKSQPGLMNNLTMPPYGGGYVLP